MFIITNKKELAIWTTETPFNKKSGIWHFYDNEDDYNFDLEYFTDKYGKKFLLTLSKVMNLYKKRGGDDQDE